jgi:hypothetical protein
VAVLLLLIGFGGVYLARRDRTTPATATVAAQVPPTITAVPSAGAAASPSTGGTPAPSGAAAATAAADPARTQIATGDAAPGRQPPAVAARRRWRSIRIAPAPPATRPALWVWNHEPGEIGRVAWAYLSFGGRYTSGRAGLRRRASHRRQQQSGRAYAAIANCYVRHPPVLRPRRRPAAFDQPGQGARPEQRLGALGGAYSTEEKAPRCADRITPSAPPGDAHYAKGGVCHWLQPDGPAPRSKPWRSIRNTRMPWVSWVWPTRARRPRRTFHSAPKTTDDVNDSAHRARLRCGPGQHRDAILHCHARRASNATAGQLQLPGYVYRAWQYTENFATARCSNSAYWEDSPSGSP